MNTELTQEQLDNMTETEVAEYMSHLLRVDRKLAANGPAKSGAVQCPECGGDGHIEGGHRCHNCDCTGSVLSWQQEAANG